MACNLSNGFARDCSGSTGGIEELYLLSRATVTSFTEANHEITAITDGGATWRKYELKKESLAANTGTAYGDRNGYDIELMAKEPETPYEVSAAAIALLTIDI